MRGLPWGAQCLLCTASLLLIVSLQLLSSHILQPPFGPDDSCFYSFATLKHSTCGVPAGTTLLTPGAEPSVFSDIQLGSALFIPALLGAIYFLPGFLCPIPAKVHFTFLLLVAFIGQSVMGVLGGVHVLTDSPTSLYFPHSTASYPFAGAYYYHNVLPVASGLFITAPSNMALDPMKVETSIITGPEFTVSSAESSVGECNILVSAPAATKGCQTPYGDRFASCISFEDVVARPYCESVLNEHMEQGRVWGYVSLGLVGIGLVGSIAWYIYEWRRKRPLPYYEEKTFNVCFHLASLPMARYCNAGSRFRGLGERGNAALLFAPLAFFLGGVLSCVGYNLVPMTEACKYYLLYIPGNLCGLARDLAIGDISATSSLVGIIICCTAVSGVVAGVLLLIYYNNRRTRPTASKVHLAILTTWMLLMLPLLIAGAWTVGLSPPAHQQYMQSVKIKQEDISLYNLPPDMNPAVIVEHSSSIYSGYADKRFDVAYDECGLLVATANSSATCPKTIVQWTNPGSAECLSLDSLSVRPVCESEWKASFAVGLTGLVVMIISLGTVVVLIVGRFIWFWIFDSWSKRRSRSHIPFQGKENMMGNEEQSSLSLMNDWDPEDDSVSEA